MSMFGLKFSEMSLHTETSKLMYNLLFLFVVLHKPTLLPSTFNFVICFLLEKIYCVYKYYNFSLNDYKYYVAEKKFFFKQCLCLIGK